MSKTVLEVKNLTKEFSRGFSFKSFKRKKPVVAIDNISFKVKQGEIVGLLGPNGAGKTTTIQMLLGTTSKTSGVIKYFGREFNKYRTESLQEVNYCSAYTKLPQSLTVYENLMVYAKLYQVDNPKERIKLLLEQFEMSDYANRQARDLSAGQATRVILVKAFINFPKVLLLDEPTASLDPDIASNVRRFLLKQQEKYNVSMLFTSHNMTEVAQVCDRVIFLRKGKIFAEDTPMGLTQSIKHCSLRLMVGDGLKRLKVFAQGRNYKIEVNDREAKIEIKEVDVAGFLNKLAEHNISYSEISIDKPSLEDYFLSFAKEDNKEGK
ncbi:MAG: ABC transporter ATP-binding protein [Candidatus Beckwithbacteria bacterium]